MSPPVQTPQTSPLPLASGRYITALGLLASTTLVALVWVAGFDPTLVAQPTIVILVVIGATSIVFPLRIYHDGSISGFSLTAASMFTTAMLLPDVHAVVLGGVMAVVGFGAATKSTVKTVFNTAQQVLASAVALAVARLIAGGDLGGDVLAPRLWPLLQPSMQS